MCGESLIDVRIHPRKTARLILALVLELVLWWSTLTPYVASPLMGGLMANAEIDQRACGRCGSMSGIYDSMSLSWEGTGHSITWTLLVGAWVPFVKSQVDPRVEVRGGVRSAWFGSGQDGFMACSL